MILYSQSEPNFKKYIHEGYPLVENSKIYTPLVDRMKKIPPSLMSLLLSDPPPGVLTYGSAPRGDFCVYSIQTSEHFAHKTFLGWVPQATLFCTPETSVYFKYLHSSLSSMPHWAGPVARMLGWHTYLYSHLILYKCVFCLTKSPLGNYNLTSLRERC